MSQSFESLLAQALQTQQAPQRQKKKTSLDFSQWQELDDDNHRRKVKINKLYSKIKTLKNRKNIQQAWEQLVHLEEQNLIAMRIGSKGH